MIAFTESFNVPTRGKGTYEITGQVAGLLARCGIKTGLATVFVQHTSASLVIYENADPTARADLHRFFEDLVPENHGAIDGFVGRVWLARVGRDAIQTAT